MSIPTLIPPKSTSIIASTDKAGDEEPREAQHNGNVSYTTEYVNHANIIALID